MIIQMKIAILIALLLGGFSVNGAQSADFAVSDLKLGPDGFLEVHLCNRAAERIHLAGEVMEKAFLTVSIQDVPRAEYKLKYIPAVLFAPGGKTVIKTNFRFSQSVKVTAVVNIPSIIPESRTQDNRLTRFL